MILFLGSSSAYSIFLTILHLSLACLPHNAEMLTAYQSLRKRDKQDSIPEQNGEGDACALCFFETRVGLL